MIGEDMPIPGVLELVLSIPGVVHAQVTAWKLDILKSPVYEWDDVEDHLIPLWLGIKTAIDETDAVQVEARKILLEQGLL
jgi:hypothetical protein